MASNPDNSVYEGDTEVIPRPDCSLSRLQCHEVENYLDAVNFLDSVVDPVVFVVMTAVKNPDLGVSWDMLSTAAEPMLWAFINNLTSISSNAQFLIIRISQTEYQNPHGCFRTDKRFNLFQLPTFINWNGPERLEGDECLEIPLLKLFFDHAFGKETSDEAGEVENSALKSSNDLFGVDSKE